MPKKLTERQVKTLFSKVNYKAETSHKARPFARTTAQRLSDRLAQAEIEKLESCELGVGE